jgi:putative ATP-binding cassette transporter
MEKVLDDNASASTESADGAALPLESLAVRHLEFDYRDAEGARLFQLGPLDLEIAAGETVFFVGGNGSGKSTLLKLLTSLYEPRSGSLLVNDGPLLDENRQSYREQVGAVFSDYHLFGRLYGLEHVTDAQANEMIDFLGLHGKTRVEDGKLETLDLSGGQRKRLGFLVALLEDRPILVLDEVAADQDPDFRRRFYDEILPELQRRGKTLLLATHDDLYFHAADRLVVLDEGKIREIVEQRPRT